MSNASLKALRSVQEFLDTELDYLIVGGGTAGLTVAARLTEDPAIRVGVLEAGDAHLHDESILTPAAFATIIESPDYDWQLKTVPQHGTHGTQHYFPRGKTLGGSSAINYLQYVRGQRHEYADWNKLTGYTHWDWDHLEPYFLKHEGFCKSHSRTVEGANDRPDSYARIEEPRHASTGPIRVSFPTWRAPIEEDWHQAASATLDIWKVPSDAWSGHHVGGFTCLATIDRSTGSGTRSYATTGYFLPNSQRTNLLVLVQAFAERIVLEERPDAEVRATGVVFSVQGKQYLKTVKREIILAAGVVQSPQLLELSGIGQRQRLAFFGIKNIIDNNQVGEGLEDHACTSISFEVDRDTYTNDWMSRDDVFEKAIDDYASGKGGPLANPIGNTAFLPLIKVASPDEMSLVLAAAKRVPKNASHITQLQRDLLIARLQDPQAASFQLTMLTGGIDASKAHAQKEIFTTGTNAISVMIVLTHPFSRGSIHINSSDPAAQPNIDPRYLDHELDTIILAIGLRFANEVLNTSPFKEKLVRRISPCEGTNMCDMESLKAYVHRHTITSYHPIGTAALGQVVDDRLKVKGVEDLRVADASVFPLHISGNIIASVYAVAEKAADMIKGDMTQSVH